MKKTIFIFFALAAMICNAQVNLSANLELCMPMSGNANDLSGNGNNGIVLGASLTTDRFGNLNSAYSFNGINNYIVVNASPSLGNTEANNEISITAWCKINNWYSGWNVFAVVNKYYLPTDYGWELNIQAPVSCPEQLFVPNGPTMSNICQFQAPGTTTFGQWNFYAVTYSKTNGQCNFYKNGALVYSIPGATYALEATASGPLYIGYSPAGPDEYADGSIDELRIYSRALNAAEINALFLGASCGSQDPQGIEEKFPDMFQVNISPNPSCGNFNFTINQSVKDAELILINSLGQNVLQQKIINGANQINTSKLNKGLYTYLLFENNLQKAIGKVVLE